MGMSTYITEQPVLTVNFEGVKILKKMKACRNTNCRNFETHSDDDFCKFFGSSIQTELTKVQIVKEDLTEIKDENGDYEEHLRFFKIFKREDNVYNADLNDGVHKDLSYDLHIFDENISNYNGNFREQFYYFFEGMSQEDKDSDLERFKANNPKMIALLDDNSIDYKIETKIVVMNS